MIKKPALLLLDDEVSAFDDNIEKNLRDSINQSRQGRTCIIIANKLCTLESADKVNLIQNGAVVEHGNHYEMMRNKLLYYNMVTNNEYC